jgi:hypothetical protein
MNAVGTPYYSIVPCCPDFGTEDTFFNFPVTDGLVPDGVYVYNSSTPALVNGIQFFEGQCYTITRVGTIFSVYPNAPSISEFTFADVCGNADLCDPCILPVQCYTLYPCVSGLPVLVSSSTTLAPLVGAFTGLVDNEGCYFVVENVLGDCTNAKNIVADPLVDCNCELNCYSITGNPISVTYVNEDLELVVTSGSTRVCSYIEPGVIGSVDGSVYNFGPCVDGLCPDICFEFTNCLTGEILIVSNTTTIFGYYTNNNVVTLQGYDGCWSIDISDQPCDCAVNVTVLQIFDDCPTCLPIIAYKFTNCNNQSIIKYSLDDYSAYVGQTVKLECGECWFVDLINYMPPAIQPIVIITTFESCLACSRTYYELSDCSGVENSIYTFTDLSVLVGYVIKIESCDTCWEVSLLEFPTIEQSSMAIAVLMTASYVDCPACNFQFPCRCSIAWPDLNGVLSYLDCDSKPVVSTGLDPDVPSEKLCVREWITAREPIYYGDCIASDGPLICISYVITIAPLIQPQTLYYKDCEGVVQTQPFTNSKIIRYFFMCGIPNQTSSDIYITGDKPVTFEAGAPCGNVPVLVCPPTIYPTRFIKPGYQTPTCDIEKYEKISCNAAEILYKTVLRARYGISNCCDGPDDRWLIKKELIDLQAAMDPNYVCTSVQSCCNNTSSCGCGCNVTSQTTCPLPPLPPPPPLVSYNCVETPTCVQYQCTIDLDGDDLITLFYINCEGQRALQSWQNAKAIISVFICSIPNATNEDIYVTGSPDFTITQTDIICKSTVDCVEVQGTSGTYQTLLECETNCSPPPVVCHEYKIGIVTYLGTSFSYIDCLGQVQIQFVLGSDAGQQIGICGIAGQTIPTPLNVISFVVTETNAICT